MPVESEKSRANNVRPYKFTFSRGTKQLLCPVGHLLYKRRQFCKASSLRGGGTHCRWSQRSHGRTMFAPTNLPFQGRQDNSSALSGITSIRGDNFAKPPLLEEVARSAGGVRGVSGEPCSPLRYAFSRTAKGYAFPLPIPIQNVSRETTAFISPRRTGRTRRSPRHRRHARR